MGVLGVRMKNGRSATAALGAAMLSLACGKVTDSAAMAGVGGTTGGVTGNDIGGTTGDGDASATSDGGGTACPGTQVWIGGRCVALGTVNPCAPRRTGFPGDSQCIEAPEPALGMQLHFGPKDYTDPEEVAKFTIAPGESGAGCMFMKTPNAARVHVKEWHARVRPGTYESILFEEGMAHADSTEPEACASGSAGSALVSVAGTDLDLSFDGGAPEYSGAGEGLDANADVAFYVSMWNRTDAPILEEAWLNGVYAKEPVTMEIAPITWLGGLAMNVSPHKNLTVHAGGSAGMNMTSCVAPAETSLIALVGSTGSHTTHMAAYLEPAGASRSLIYESFDWSAPVRLYYDSAVRNPSPTRSSRTAGGPSGILALHPGDAVSWECEIDNTTDGALTYSDDPSTGEICNFYGAYGAGTKAWNCYSP